jgi:hypothetical protein
MFKGTKRGAVIFGVGLASVLLCGGTAQAEPTPPPPVAVEVLTPRAAFTDNVSLQAHLKLDGSALR